jgi:hypothetical protein
MNYHLASTEWPSYTIRKETKQLIANLFSALDDTGSRAGDRLADEVFATDGVFEGTHGARGTEGIYYSFRKIPCIRTSRTTTYRCHEELPEANINYDVELRRCRDNAWKVIRKRRHEIQKIYVANAEAADLLLLGRVGAELNSGKTITSEFAARLVIDNADITLPKVKLYQVFLVSYEVVQTLQLDMGAKSPSALENIKLTCSKGQRTGNESATRAMK